MRTWKGLALTGIVLIGMVCWAGVVAGAQAQAEEAPSALPMEIGLRVPLAGLLSVALDEQVHLEASAAIPGFSAPLVDFEGRLVAKLYPTAWEFDVGELSLRPFVGGGVAVFQAVGKWVPGLVGAVGLETPAPALGLPLMIFTEGDVTLLMSGSAPTLAFELSLGMRYPL